MFATAFIRKLAAVVNRFAGRSARPRRASALRDDFAGFLLEQTPRGDELVITRERSGGRVV